MVTEDQTGVKDREEREKRKSKWKKSIDEEKSKFVREESEK